MGIIVEFQYNPAYGGCEEIICDLVKINRDNGQARYVYRGDIIDPLRDSRTPVYIGKDNKVYNLDFNEIGSLIRPLDSYADNKDRVNALLNHISVEVQKLASLNPDETIKKSQVRGILNDIAARLKEIQ